MCLLATARAVTVRGPVSQKLLSPRGSTQVGLAQRASQGREWLLAMWEAALVAALAVAAALWFLVLRLARAPLHPERGAFGVGVETQKEASSKADVPSSRLSVKPRSAAGGAASSGAESEGLSREGEPAAANSPAVPLLSAESDACEEGLAEEEPVVGNGAASKDESPVQPETKNLVARTSETSSADEVSATEEMVGDAKAADESFKDFVASPQPDECSVSSQHSPRGASSKPQEENLPHACSEHGEMEADEEGEALSSRPPPLPPAESDAASSNAEGVGQTSAEAQLPACASSAEEHAIPQVREAAFDNSQGSPSEKPAIFEGRNGEAPLSACVAGLGEVTAVGEVISETEEVAKAKVHCRSPREKVEKSAESHTFNKAEAAASVSPPEEEGSLPRFELLDSEDDDGEEHKTPEDLKEEANDRFRCGSISAALRLYTAAIARADERVEELEDRLDALEKEAEEELLRQGGAADSPSAATERPGLPCEEGDSVAAHSGADEDSAGRRRGEAASGETDEGEHPAVRHLPQERREEYRDKLARLRATDELLAVLKSNRLAAAAVLLLQERLLRLRAQTPIAASGRGWGGFGFE